MKWMLLFALVVSNLAWAGKIFLNDLDRGISYTYYKDSCEHREHAFTELRNLAPKLAKGLPKEEFLRLVSSALPRGSGGVFEKDGCIWAGSLGYFFDDQDRLQFVSYDDANDANDPCRAELGEEP